MTDFLRDFHFLRPLWLLALPLGALIVVAYLRGEDPRYRWRHLISEHLLPHLLVASTGSRQLRPVHVLAVAWVVAVVALAGPTWQREPSPFTEDTAALVVALHVGETMRAQDVQPSRLQRAAQKVRDLLELRPGAQTALVAYAGSAHLVMPLTRDANIIETFVAELAPDVMPGDGDAAAAAVALAEEQLRRSQVSGSILLVTDAVAADQVPALAAHRRAGGAPVHLLAVAAEDGAPVPLDSPPAAALHRSALQKAADATGGNVVVVSPDDRDVRQLARYLQTSFAAATQEDGGERWQDAGYYLVPVVALLCLMWFRSGWSIQWTAAVALLIPLTGTTGSAETRVEARNSKSEIRTEEEARNPKFDIRNSEETPSFEFRASDFEFVAYWFLTADQQAQRHFDRGEYAEAARLFTDPMRRGTALYRDGQFAAAAAAFARAGTAEAAFNRGNSLVLLGKYDDAMASYDQALQMRPQWPAAAENRELARLREERMAPPEDDYGGTGGMLGADEIVFSDRGSKSSGDTEQVDAGGDGPLSEQALRALWLRRVQTKPADFLRSKFAYQYLREQKHEAKP